MKKILGLIAGTGDLPKAIASEARAQGYSVFAIALDPLAERSLSSYVDEIEGVASDIQHDINDGLRPDDILVAVVDDLHAKTYLSDLSEALKKLGIQTHNIHADQYNLQDFQREGFVTLSTVHKAKGNEAYAVYVVGVDALFTPYAGGRSRNILYTAMTRAKGWVKVSGVGPAATEF